MRKNLQYIFFNLLLSLRGIIRLVFRTITLLTILGACIMLSQDKSLSLSCFIAVSYTHLDVYKRQIYGRMSIPVHCDTDV